MRVIDVKEFQTAVGENLKPIAVPADAGTHTGEAYEAKLQKLRAASKLSRAAGAAVGLVGDQECCKPGKVSHQEREEAVGRLLFWVAAYCHTNSVDMNLAMSKMAEKL
jgi:hypothetical protein